ncbi:hypothetical protein HK104_001035, partial [Borealophlyctis nickersoniae]
MKPPAPRTPQLPQNKDPAPTGNSQPPATPVKLIAQPRLKNADRFFRSEQPMAPRPEPATPESAASSVDDRSPPAVKTPAPHPRDAFTGSQKRPSDEEWLEESRKRSRQEQGPPQRGLHDSFFPEEDEEEYNTMFETPGAWQEGAGYAPQNGAHQDGGESDPEAYGFDNTGFDPRNHWQNTARGETNNPSSQSQAPVRADESSERSTRPPENFHQSQQDVQIPRNEQVTHEEDGQDRGADGAFAAMHQLNDDEAKTQIEGDSASTPSDDE